MPIVLYSLQPLKAWEEEGSFKDNILQDNRITGYISADELESLFDVKYHLSHINTIIKRLDDKHGLLQYSLIFNLSLGITLEK